MEVKKYLQSEEFSSEILRELNGVLEKKSFNYRTLGTEIENHVCNKVISLFITNGLIKSKSEIQTAENKNEFPDFTILTTPRLGLEIKSGRRNKRDRQGAYVPVKNSQNDMGTLGKWGDKLQEFKGDNIFCLFIEYIFFESTPTNNKIVAVKVAPFYRFLGLNRDGFLSYREKDGNLRPKDFDSESPITSCEQFERLLPETIIYRSTRIIKKHWKNIPVDRRGELLRDLQNQ